MSGQHTPGTAQVEAMRAAITEAERESAQRRADIRGLTEWAAVWTAIIAVVALLITYAPTAHAATVGLHLGTKHINVPEGRQMRDANPGLYLRLANGATFGAYRNSNNRDSAYAAWTFETPGRTFAVTAGVVTGYAAQRFAPLLVPSMRIPLFGATSARLAYIPKPRTQGAAAGVHLSLETDF